MLIRVVFPLALAGLFSVVVAAVNDGWNFTTTVAGIATIGVALAALVKSLTPILIDSLRALSPVWVELRKQRDKVFEGTLSHRLFESRTSEAAARKIADEATEKQEKFRKEAEEAIGFRDKQIESLRERLDILNTQLKEASENSRILMAANHELKEEIKKFVSSSHEPPKRGRKKDVPE